MKMHFESLCDHLQLLFLLTLKGRMGDGLLVAEHGRNLDVA